MANMYKYVENIEKRPHCSNCWLCRKSWLEMYDSIANIIFFRAHQFPTIEHDWKLHEVLLKIRLLPAKS